MRLEVDGVQYDNFEAATVESRLDAFGRKFSFATSSEDGVPLPVRGGESCKIYVDGDLVLTGAIDVVSGSGDSASHEITVEGRSLTSDLADSTLGVMSDLRPPITLKTIAERVIANIGSTLSVVDLVGAAPFNSAEDLAAPESGDKAIEFLEKFARKRQVLLTDDEQGRLILARSTGASGSGFLVHRPDDRENNVLSYSFSYDGTNRFQRYLCVCQRNAVPSSLQTMIDLDAISGQVSPVVVDRGAREGRQLVISSESLFSAAEGAKRATWEANVRKARSQVYSAVVDGFRDQGGALWLVNRLVRVDDVFAGLDTVMLVNSVQFFLTEDGGSQTTLSLVNRDAYLLELSEPEKESGEVGIGLKIPVPQEESQ